MRTDRPHELAWKRSALKELKKLPASPRRRILQAIESLPEEPRPPGARKLSGAEHTFRIRVGSYRIVYSVYDRELMIEIIRVRHRKDAY